jgi:RNA polymerase sigma-B factor
MPDAKVGQSEGEDRRSSAEALLAAYHDDGDMGARRRLIEDHMPLVRRLAHRFAGRGEQVDDLVQVGAIGLIKAIDCYRPARGGDLGAYAVPTILGELRRHLRDRTPAIRAPRTRLGSGPPVPVVLLEEEAPVLARPCRELEESEGRAVVRDALAALDGRERRIVALHYYGDLPQRRIAAAEGLTQTEVCRLLGRSLAKMRRALEAA